ncbi:MAG: PAS domain S-box protein [Archangium sp.]|nr:PAS domain S-box protein [Archangium sp.]
MEKHQEPGRALFEALTDAVVVVDEVSGLILDVNPAAARTYGYAPQELRGQPIAVLGAGGAPSSLTHHRRKDGTTFPAELSTSVMDWAGRRANILVVRDVTLLSSAFYGSPLLLAVSDLATDRYLEVNDAFCARIGFSRDEVVGRTAVELGLIDLPGRDALAAKLMAALPHAAFELVIRSRSGAPLICRYWGTVLHTAAGPRLFAAAEDVTERRQDVNRLEKIASMVPGVVYQFRLRPDGTSSFPFSSAAIRQVYRVTPEEVKDDAAAVFRRIHPEDVARVTQTIQRSARELSPWRDEYRVRYDDGVVRWLRGDAVPEQEADGSVLWHGFISDITERKQADEALKKSEARFELAMDATSDGLWDWDIATDVGYFSPGYYRMLGYDPDSFTASGQSWSELIHPDDRAAAQQANQDCIEGRRERFEVEYRMKSKAGDWRWILGRGKAVARDPRGRALRMLGTHVDITERKRMEAGLAQSDRLASMGMLAAGVAHEINNPLSYVLASLDALAQELPKLGEVAPAQLADLVDCAQSALEGTRRIRKISRSLGAFSRVERVEVNNIDLNQTIETAATMAHNEVKYRAALVKELGQVPAVLASDGKLAQVFLNLIINAAHAIDEGHVDRNRITVRTWSDGRDVFARVEDTGHGIPPENLERIFEPFFTTKKAGVGSGLGLSISRNIVSEFGGDLVVESTVGEGTRLTVRLPASTSTVSPAPVSPIKRPEPTLRGRVLVVDDEAAIRRVLERMLSQRHEVVTATSGREAQALLERDGAFDVILCDVMMPEVTGVDLHAWLERHAPVLARRLVFISGGAFTPSASDYLATVSNLRLDKPFDPLQLLELVTRLVRAARGELTAAGA